MAEYKPPGFPAGIRPGSRYPSARGLQRALKGAGYMSRLVPEADNYGPATSAAVRKFHSANPAYGRSSDPAIGPKGWAHLHQEAYGSTTPTPDPEPPAPPSAWEPAHDYTRTTHSGRTVNKRTDQMIHLAQERFGASIHLTQGSYNRGGVAASAGTHDGGGVIDISVSGMSASRRNQLVKALRQVGFAAWLRTPSEGFSYHIHACAIGDREMASGARSQVTSYFNGRNGLRNNNWDSAPASVGRPYPSWANKYN